MNFLRFVAIALAFVVLNAHARGSVPIINHEAIPAVTASGQPANSSSAW